MTPRLVAAALCVPLFSVQAAIHGRVMYASKGVPGIWVRLAKNWSGMHYGLPGGEDTTTGADGGFSFHKIDPATSYTLIVRGFHEPDRTDALVEVSDAEKRGQAIRINLIKPMQLEAPTYGAYLAEPAVRIQWRPLPEAVRYEVLVESRSTATRPKAVSMAAGGTQTSIKLTPGGHCVHLTAFDRESVKIGGTELLYGASYAPATHCFVVGDPAIETKTVAATGVCAVRGDIVHVYIKPSASRAESDRASFVVLGGESVKLLGRLGTWTKVASSRGLGWVPATDLSCGN